VDWIDEYCWESSAKTGTCARKMHVRSAAASEQVSGASDAAPLLARSLGLTRTFSRLLAARGYDDPTLTGAFLDAKLADLSPPDAMIDRAAAADRLAYAARNHERVVVFGDYDVDGITSAAIMTLVLRAFGADVTTILASRFDGGYGFSARALERVLEARPGCVVTCDCGSSDHARLHELRRKGVDAVVIDHHLVPKETLPVHAFLNPHRPECGFSFKHLASCGLALSLGAALRAKLGIAFDLRPLLDLVALGTIADVAPLVSDNRALTKAGLARICAAPRPGVDALLEVAKIPPGVAISGEDVAFRLAPRINAPGRLGDPKLAFDLLVERDLGRARELAAQVEEQCRARREIERKIVDEAVAQVEATGQREAPSIVVAAEGWHVGVVGIVAARLVDRFGVPSVVIALDGEEGRGSVRGPSGSRLYDALNASKEALVGFGGHQAAAGVHVAAKHVESLRERFANACVSCAPTPPGGATSGVVARHDVALDPEDDLSAVMLDLERFEPCGEGNLAPVLRVEEAKVTAVRVHGDHLRLVVRQGRRLIDAFGYGLASDAPAEGSTVELRGRLRRDTYRGRGAVELRMVGLHLITNVPRVS